MENNELVIDGEKYKITDPLKDIFLGQKKNRSSNLGGDEESEEEE